MPLRILSLLIILFWLGSVGWLCTIVFAPPESRMREIDPREVTGIFFAWNEATNMTLLENGKRRGQVRIAGGSGEDPKTGMFLNSASVSTVLETYSPLDSSNMVDLFAKGTVDFSEEMEVKNGSLSVRSPQKGLDLHLSFEGSPMEIEAVARMGERELFRLDSSMVTDTTKLPTNLIPFNDMLGLSKINPAEMKWEQKARVGKFTFGGRDMQAYLLQLRMEGQDAELRIYLSEAGEPLKVETDFGFEAVSEILVPLDAYRSDSDTK